MTWYVIRRGETIATVEAGTKREAQIMVARQWGLGPWVTPKGAA